MASAYLQLSPPAWSTALACQCREGRNGDYFEANKTMTLEKRS
jgi:hypothetical protein